MIEPAGPREMAPIVLRAYGLTSRERTVAQEVIKGCSTREMSDHLYVSQDTIQHHLKWIFAKTGVRSRHELVAKVFAEDYRPRN